MKLELAFTYTNIFTVLYPFTCIHKVREEWVHSYIKRFERKIAVETALQIFTGFLTPQTGTICKKKQYYPLVTFLVKSQNAKMGLL